MISFLPLSSALADTYTLIEEGQEDFATLEEWSSLALFKLHVRHTYQEKIAIHKVIDHKSCLPKGTLYVEGVFYSETADSTNLPTIPLSYQLNGDELGKQLTYGDMLCALEETWLPLRAATSIFNLTVHCQNSINLTCNCEHTYSIGKQGDITTSLKSGYLAMGVLSYPTDKNGEFLVPDDPDVLEAIKDYVLSRIWERKMNYGVDNAFQLHKHYLTQFETRAAKARGKLMLPSMDELQNLQDQLLRIGQHTGNWYTGFGNLSTPESVVF